MQICKTNNKACLPNQPLQTIFTKLNQYAVSAWVSSAFGNVSYKWIPFTPDITSNGKELN